MVIHEFEENEGRTKAAHSGELSSDGDEVDGELDFVGEDTVGLGQLVELLINSMVGLIAPGIMKLKGMLGPNKVVVLVDSGASHNFISVDLVH